ncbi:chemotaxis protein CheC [Gammaproteobacteria bacterium]
MNELLELHLDALTEVFNVGAGRAASSLSEIVSEEIELSVPRIQFYQSSEITAKSLSLDSPRLGAVKQHFNGPFDSTAMLLFTEERALEIVRDMMGSQLDVEELAEFEQEAMCELGNIILNACLSVMADMLGLTLASSLPVYFVDTSEVIIQQIVNEDNHPVMLALHIDLNIKARHSNGYLVFLFSSSSLTELVSHIDSFLLGIPVGR